MSELRLILTVADVDAALAVFRDALGLDQLAAWETDASRGYLLAAGRATLELADEGHAAKIDRLEVRHRVAGPVRVATAPPSPHGWSRPVSCAWPARWRRPGAT